MKDIYVSFTPTQLAGEDDFIRWVRYGENDAAWQAWSLHYPDTQTQLAEARRIVEALSASSPASLSAGDQFALWQRIQTKVRPEQQPKGSRLRPLWTWGLAAAASLALLVWFNYRISSENIYAAAGESKEVTLPEESVVTLNASSFLMYKDNTFEKKRTLNLEGEAFFKVKPGSTFAVRTASGTVTVLGTSFNVMARDNRFEVSCYTGKVKVETASGETLVLEPGQKSVVTTTGEKPNKATFDPAASSPEWIRGKFHFDNQPLPVVIDELKRQYNIEVKMAPGLDALMYTGLFESGDLEKALPLITWPLHLQFKIEGNTVTIYR